MYCPKCGNEIKEKMKFCFNCGEKLDFETEEENELEVTMDNSEEIKAKETNDVKEDEHKHEPKTTEDSNVESKKIITEEDISMPSSNKEKYSTSQQITSNLTITDKIKRKCKEVWNQLSLFSRILTILIAFSAFLGFIALLCGKTLSIVIAVLQIVLFVVGWLMQKDKIKQVRKWLPYLLIVLAILLFVPFFSTFSSNGKPDVSTQSTVPDKERVLEKLQWPENKLAQLVPKPKSMLGYVEWEHDDEIKINIGKTSKDDYMDYKKMCAEKGFTTVTSEDTSFYYANNDDGYRLKLTYTEDKEVMSITVSEPLYTITIEIDCAANLIFSKYDLKVLVDSNEIGTLKHGEKDTFNVDLENGAHTLEIQNAEDSSVKGNVDFNVDQNNSHKYNVSCKSDKVNIEEESKVNPPIVLSELGDKSYDDVQKLFTDAGFTDVSATAIDDLTVDKKDNENKASDISIDGKSDFTKDTSYFKNVKVVITYHTFSEEKYDEAMRNALESTFPVENAKRAAVVTITNATAIDVFAKDGNTLDATKFHSYSDTSGNFYNYYIKVNSWGTWTAKDEKSWHVDSLELENSLGNPFDLSLDVAFNGTDYLVSNIKGTYGSLANTMDISEVVTENDESIYLKVPTKLIKNDRADTLLDTHRDWVESGFSSWDGSYKELSSLIKANLNDEKSFKHIETSYIEVVNDQIRDEINKTIKSANKQARVEIGDLWITTEFSAKNAFNATIKNTAYGIASFKDNTIILVAIE